MTGLAIAGVLGSTALSDSKTAAAAASATAVGLLVASGNEAGMLASGVSVAMDTACVPVLAEATATGAVAAAGSDGTAPVAGTTIAPAADPDVAAAAVVAAEAGCGVTTLASGVLVAMKTACSGQNHKGGGMPACGTEAGAFIDPDLDFEYRKLTWL
ncbi:hypothetical protein WJX77_002842 [Trebouxia sp. C0004]